MLFLCPEPNMELQNRCECGLAVRYREGDSAFHFETILAR